MQSALLSHTSNKVIHVTQQEHIGLQRLLTTFPDIDPDAPPTTAPVPPAGAMTQAEVYAYLTMFAQPGVTRAPGHVFGSRVPWAYIPEGSTNYTNTSPTVDTNSGVSAKLWDNEGLEHKCSTDLVENVDDYIGKRWAFFCAHCNYITDQYGVKHITAIEGYNLDGHTYDETANIGVFGPKFWFFCKCERYSEDGVTYNTVDGTAEGAPKYQLWGISDRAYAELDEARQAELAKHDILESDFHIYPFAQEVSRRDENGDAVLVDRPYWVHSAYLGGVDENDTSLPPCSKKRKPLFTGFGYQSINAKYGYSSCRGSGAIENGFGMLFDIVKNATKNSQNIHMGACRYGLNSILTTYNTVQPSNLFPIRLAGNTSIPTDLGKWVTVFMDQANSFYLGAEGMVYTENLTRQWARVTAIEQRTIQVVADDNIDTTTGGVLNGATTEEVTALCLVLDTPESSYFVTRTDPAMAALVSSGGQYAHSYARYTVPALSGETDVVMGKHDGYAAGGSTQLHPYRVQLTEHMVGLAITSADIITVLGNGETSVTINGEEIIPTTSQRVVFYAGHGVTRVSTGAITNLPGYGYKAIGIVPTPTSGNVYIANVQLSHNCIAIPAGVGGGISSSTGHGDSLQYTTYTTPFAWTITPGYSYDRTTGSAYLGITDDLAGRFGYYTGARD